MYVKSLLFISLTACLVVDCSSIRNTRYYAFIKYNPNGIQANTHLLRGECTLVPYLNKAYDKLVEHKKYGIPMVAAMVTEFTLKSLWNLFPFKFSSKKTSSDTPHLNVYKCSKCNYTIYPAKDRDDKFIGQKFTCPSCTAPYTDFTIDRN